LAREHLGITVRLDWKVVAVAFVAAPLAVLLHELAHVGALECGGVDAHLRGFSMGMPVDYFWDFDGLENAKQHFGVSAAVFVFAALAGPVTTLLIAYGSLLVYWKTKSSTFWTVSFSAIALRVVGITSNIPRFLNGSMNTSDEAIAAHFSGAPLASYYWPSLLIGYLCIYLLFSMLERKQRVVFGLSALTGTAVGYFSIDTLANALIFKPAEWIR
jgi:hypothetical protein